jgi:hypothetical protein
MATPLLQELLLQLERIRAELQLELLLELRLSS